MMAFRIHFLIYFFALLISFHANATDYISIFEDDKDALAKQWERLPHNASNADKMIRSLMQTNNYESASVYRLDNGEFAFYAVPLKKIAKVEITGESELGETDIMNALALKEGTAIDDRKINRGVEKLRELYGRNGLFSPEIRIDIQPAENSGYLVNVDIKENEPTKIEEVTIITANATLVRKLSGKIRGLQGENFSDSAIREFEAEVQTLLRDQRYLNARLLQKDARYNQAKTKAYLTYEIINPYYFRIEFIGNKESNYTHADLMRAIDIENFDRTSLNPAAELADKVRDHYINEGFAFAKVSFETRVRESDFVRYIDINIEEGEKINIDRIDVGGRISRPADHYSDFIFDNSSETVENGYYVKSDLELGYRNLITSLKNEGYLRAKILSARADFNENKSNVIVNVLLDEGPLTRVAEVRIKGNKDYDTEKIKELLDIQENAALHFNHLEEGIENVINTYKADGYIEARVITPEKDILSYSAEDARATIDLEIHEGPKVTVREIIVEGNNYTKDYVLLLQSEIEVGDILTPESLENARKRLQALDIFSRVELRTLEHDTMTSNRALLISVTEKNPGSFRIGFGLSNKQDITARGFSGITYSNLFGTARAVSLRGILENNLANTDIRSYDVSLSYLEPFLFNTSARGRVSLSREVYITRDPEKENLDGKTINRLAFFTEKDFGQNIRFIWNTWSLESIETYEVPASDVDDRQQVATIGPIIDLDFRDNPFLPTSGHFTRLEADYSSPFLGSSDQIHFVRTQATFSFYTDIYKGKWIWANSLRGGYARNMSTLQGSGIPENYAFFLGGYTTIRGYSGFEDDRIPTDQILGLEQDNQLIIPDESSYHLVKSELRFPLSGILGGVLFYDGGAVTVKNKQFADSTGIEDRSFEGQAVGVGLRINTPVGPVSLDYGRKLKVNAEDEDRDHFHLSIGTF